ncbi:MAG: biotin--[acetyl-CoA-carboxylase] ligase [Planctomycetes bacterium]|nr:biotin--[acetyl-CoA-carboxylase] ligase [Planctomycetota bacterium]
MTKTDLLDAEKLKVNTKRVGRKILVYNSTSSTNDIAAEYVNNKKNDGLAIFAEEQTAGRGRTGNKWLTGYADSILCSILLTKKTPKSELLSLTVAVAVAGTIGKIVHTEAKIKWPNDIILNNKKVAGIILESKKINGHFAYIIGIGINCHQKKDTLPTELKKIATSLDIESKTTSDRISIAKRLLTSLDHWLKVAEKNSDKVIKQWKKLSILMGHRTTLIFDGKKFTGNCIGIDPENGLILQLERGGVRMFDAAHTTIAK